MKRKKRTKCRRVSFDAYIKETVDRVSKGFQKNSPKIITETRILIEFQNCLAKRGISRFENRVQKYSEIFQQLIFLICNVYEDRKKFT